MVNNLIYVIISAVLLYCLSWIIMFVMDYLQEIESLVWFILAIPISFVLLLLIINISLKIITALSRRYSNVIINGILISLGIFYGISQIYFLWKDSDLSYARQIIIAIYGTLCLMSGYGNILDSMHKTVIANKVSEKMKDYI